jgi:hypothetical protein
MAGTSDGSRNRGPFIVDEAETSRRVFRKPNFLGNFHLAFPDKGLGPGALRDRISKSAQ